MATNTLDDRKRAFEIIKAKSFVLGDIILSSGEKSDHYFDMKPAMFDPEGVNILCRLILSRIAHLNVDYIGGLEMGAVPLIAPLAMISGEQGRPIPGFFVRKAPKEHGTRKLIEGVVDLIGKNIVVVDDVTTTGQSAMKAINELKAAGAIIKLVLSVVDRQSGASEFYAKEGIPFQSLFTASDFLDS